MQNAPAIVASNPVRYSRRKRGAQIGAHCNSPYASGAGGYFVEEGARGRLMLMDLPDLKAKIQAGQFKFSLHADLEAEADNLAFSQVIEAILSGEVLESYPDTGRGESCLIVGLAGGAPVHAVCGLRGESVIIVTVYVPQPPKFIDPWTRGDEESHDDSPSE
jgi:hypothetical protein